MTTRKAPLRAAIIGLGRMGSTFDDENGPYNRWRYPHAHAACYREVDGVELVAGADAWESQRDTFGQRWGLDQTHLYADYRQMIEQEKPDVVSICTSAGPRARILLDVAGIGSSIKGFWVEKPIAVSLAEADQMVDTCRRQKILLAMCASRCWDPIYVRMRDLIERGEIGDVLQVNGNWSCQLSSNGSHLLTLVSYLAGGPHASCRWVWGEVEEAEAAGDGDLRGNGYLGFDNGVRAYVRSMACGGGDGMYEVIGTKGRLRAVNDGEEVEFWKLIAPTLPGRRRAEPARQMFPPPDRARTANALLLEDLLKGIETGKEPNCNGEAGRQALEIAIAMRESHRKGTRIDLPLSDRSLAIHSADAQHGDIPAAVRRAQAAASR